jgi:hypothetical protein
LASGAIGKADAIVHPFASLQLRRHQAKGSYLDNENFRGKDNYSCRFSLISAIWNLSDTPRHHPDLPDGAYQERIIVLGKRALLTASMFLKHKLVVKISRGN